MAIWIPVIVGVAIAIALLAGGLNWDKILIHLRGKKIAVLGERMVGKTTLIKFLTEGWLPKDYKGTIGEDPVKAKRYRLRDLDLKLKETRDVPGDTAKRVLWKKLFDESDIVLYLVRADRLLQNHSETQSRARRDIEHISRWLREAKNEDRAPELVAIVGTFADKEPDFNAITEKTLADYQDRFARHSVVKQMALKCRGLGNVIFAIGSLQNEDRARDLVYILFSQIQGMRR